MKKKITLFWPPIPQGSWGFRIYPSLGMAYLDAVLRDTFDVTVIDSNIVHGSTAEFYKNYNEKKYPGQKVDEIWDRILLRLIKITEDSCPEFLCVGSWTYNMPFIAEFTRVFKARNPDIPIILGGINPTLIPEETLQTLPYLDFLVRGEGEDTILELLNVLSSGGNINNVSGLSFWQGGKIVHTADRGYVRKLDKLPFMDYENFLGFKRWNKGKDRIELLQVLTSRGCVAKCSFCTIHQVWKMQRFYSDEYVLGQIKHLNDLYDFRADIVSFMDDNFVVKFDKTKKLANKFHAAYPDHKWQIVDMRIDALKSGFFDYMSKRGCEFAGFGVESVNSKSLNFLNKTIDPITYKKIVLKMLANAEKAKVRTMLSSILGSPNETKKEMIDQANFYVKVFNDYKYSYFDVAPLVIHPATDLWYKYLDNKLKVYKRPHHASKRFYEGMYADKWDHLLFMVPNAYRVENTKMPRMEFETLLTDLIKNKLIVLAREAKRKLEREKTCYIEYQ